MTKHRVLTARGCRLVLPRRRRCKLAPRAGPGHAHRVPVGANQPRPLPLHIAGQPYRPAQLHSWLRRLAACRAICRRARSPGLLGKPLLRLLLLLLVLLLVLVLLLRGLAVFGARRALPLAGVRAAARRPELRICQQRLLPVEPLCPCPHLSRRQLVRMLAAAAPPAAAVAAAAPAAAGLRPAHIQAAQRAAGWDASRLERRGARQGSLRRRIIIGGAAAAGALAGVVSLDRHTVPHYHAVEHVLLAQRHPRHQPRVLRAAVGRAEGSGSAAARSARRQGVHGWVRHHPACCCAAQRHASHQPRAERRRTLMRMHTHSCGPSCEACHRRCRR